MIMSFQAIFRNSNLGGHTRSVARKKKGDKPVNIHVF